MDKATALVMLDIIDTAENALDFIESASNVSLAQSLRTKHSQAAATKQTKVHPPRIGDIVGWIDEKGEILDTGVVRRKPAQFTTIQFSDGRSRDILVSTSRLERIGPKEWIVRVQDL